MKKMQLTVNRAKFLLIPCLLLAQSAVAEIDPARQSELLYFIKHDCGSCHGMTLKGGLGPALLPEIMTMRPKEYLVNTILEGRKNTAMPPWKSIFSQAEARWIAEQLQNGNARQTALAANKQNLEPANSSTQFRSKTQ